MRRTKDLMLVLVVSVLALIVLITVFAPWLAPHDPLAVDMSAKLMPPSADHLLGTDALGRDVFSRVLHGGRTSILLAVVASCLSMSLGMALGVLAGYCGGAVDGLISGISNVFQGLPGTILMIALVGVLGSNTRSILLALVITSWVGFSRMVRGEVMRVKGEGYIEGMRCLGAGHLHIILKNILPNIRATIIVLFTTRVGRVVLSVSGLSYLSIGIQPPTPDWGAMIGGSARRYFRTSPNLLWAPGLCIIVLALCINVLGDLLRDKYDVKKDAVKEW